jgi:regulatory protein
VKKEDKNEQIKAALKKAMELCAGREYCREDIRIKLNSWGLDDREAASVISTLIRDNFINEARYASAFVRDKFRYNKWGKLKIAAHLGSKKVDEGSIRSALESLDEDQYRQTVKDILFEHRRTIKAKNQFDLKGKLMRFGQSRGYESNLLYDIINNMD